MPSKFVGERTGVVSKIILSERDDCVRVATGKDLNTVDHVLMDAAELRVLGRQCYMLARRLDKRNPS